jgi:hypothetical protein
MFLLFCVDHYIIIRMLLDSVLDIILMGNSGVPVKLCTQDILYPGL